MRLAPASTVARAPKREFISRSYNFLLRALLATRVRDMQCGFKAVRADAEVGIAHHIRHFVPWRNEKILDRITAMGVDYGFVLDFLDLMPPTLVASIYGMNFKHLPELDFEYGYPMALILMAITAILPVWYFRRRGWL